MERTSTTARKLTPRKLTLRKLTLALLGAGAVASGAVAQIADPEAPLRFKTDYLGYAASISPRAVYTDNIDLSPDAEKEDATILSTVLAGSAIFSKKRFTGIVNGELDFSYLLDDEDFRINQDVGGVGTVTLVDNWLYVDVAGQSERQLVGDAARFSANPNAARDQRAGVHSFSASPYLFRKFANQAAATLRYRFTQVFIDDDEADTNPGNGDLLNDSSNHEVYAAYETGSLFDRMRFLFSAFGAKTVESGSDVVPRFEYEQGTLTAEAEYALTPSFSLSGAVGYDDIEIQSDGFGFDDNDISGVFWRAGFSATPGRRSSVRVEYGRRYDDNFVDAELSYDISQRFTLSAGASRTFETRAQGLASRFRSLELQTLEFANRLRDGEAASPEAIIDAANEIGGVRFAAQTIGLSTTNSAYTLLAGAFDRTTISLGATYENSDFGFRENENIGLSIDLTRALSRRARVYGGAFYRRTDTDVGIDTCVAAPFVFGLDVSAPGFDAVAACTAFADANGVTSTVGGRIGAAYQIYKNVSIFGEYAHTQRFSPVDELEYGENTAITGLILDF